jgi:pimeloyl-ACP methyl ester carboxylesterase
MRRVLLVLLVLLVAALVVNTIVTDNETKQAKADIGRIVHVPRGDVQIREDGSRDDPTIVMLHGFAGSMHWWTPTTTELSDKFHIVRIDLLGHGGSDKPEDGYSIPDQAKLVAQVLAELDVQHAVIAGHSMGGTVATGLAQLDPSLVDGLVLVASPPDSDSGKLGFTARLGFVPVLGEAIWRLTPDDLIRANLDKAFADGFDVPDQFVEDVNRMTYSSYDGAGGAGDHFQDDESVVDRLKSLRKPLMVIYGTNDEIVEPDSREQFREVPGAIVNAIPDTGHSPMVEKPDVTAGLMSVFARRASRAAERRRERLAAAGR